MIDLSRLREAKLAREPFDHLVVPGFVAGDSMRSLAADFPCIERGGSFPVEGLRCGPAFGELVCELRGERLRAVVAEKFGVDLDERPTLITVRGQARAKDGRIHADSRSKILTGLVYLNQRWRDAGGRLRLLRSSASLDDYVREVAPELGTSVFFRCTRNAWHGHTPFVGERRVVQLNWVTDESVVRREQSRHRFSALLKRWLPV